MKDTMPGLAEAMRAGLSQASSREFMIAIGVECSGRSSGEIRECANA